MNRGCPRQQYSTDVSLLNKAGEQTEQIIDWLYKGTEQHKKPRTYLKNQERTERKPEETT